MEGFFLTPLENVGLIPTLASMRCVADEYDVFKEPTKFLTLGALRSIIISIVLSSALAMGILASEIIFKRLHVRRKARRARYKVARQFRELKTTVKRVLITCRTRIYHVWHQKEIQFNC